MYVDVGVDDIHTGLSVDNYFESSKLKLQPLRYDIESAQMVVIQKFLNNGIRNKNWIYYFNNTPLISALTILLWVMD